MAEYWDRERGRRWRGEGYYGGYYGYPEHEHEYERRGGDRGFFDRAGDEVRSWFGDEEAHRRRMRDERERRPEERGWGSSRERGWGGWREDDDAERERDPRGWGYRGGYGAGPGFTGGRSLWISRTVSGPYAGRGPRGYQRSDERIREDVCERMCEN